MNRYDNYWKHIRKLAHQGLPAEAISQKPNQKPCIVSTEKSGNTVNLTLEDPYGAHLSRSIPVAELLSRVSEYRRQAILTRPQDYDFDAYIAKALFNIDSNKRRQPDHSATPEGTLGEMVETALDLCREQRAIDKKYQFATRRPLRILVASMRSYPFGGGEAWILESSIWLQSQGHDVVIINFKECDWSLIPFNTCELVRGVPRIGIEMVDTESKVIGSLRNAISLFVPDIIHCQGELNSIINQHYNPAWPPVVCGYHFWNGIVQLGENKNKAILANIGSAAIDQSFATNTGYPRYNPYIVSAFMGEVIRRAGFQKEIRRIPPAEKRPANAISSSVKESVFDCTQLNCSLLKGGISFIRLAHALDDLKFFGLCALWEELVELYEAAQQEGFQVSLDGNELRINDNSLIRWEWVDDASTVIRSAKVLLSLSLVDETYGRVIAEAIQLGRPVIASNKGNHRYLLPPDYLVNPESTDEIRLILRELISQPKTWKAAISEQIDFLDSHTECGRKGFLEFINEITKTCCLNHVAILAPWSEQGLGYHAKIYADALLIAGIEPHIYSFQPYAAENIGLVIQSEPREWAGYDVHFSYNHRESLTAREIQQFCIHKNCKLLIVPEVCWEVNWRRLKELSSLGIDVIPVPNPETIRKSEIAEHIHFPKVLCSTQLAQEILTDHGISNTCWIGHGYGPTLNEQEISSRLDLLRRYEADNVVKLIHIAGYNHKRKMTRELLSVLGPLLSQNRHIHLRVLSQVPFNPECYSSLSDASNIEMIHGGLSHAEILAEYRQASFSLQMSTHEGLGLGFYESVSCGTPVITIDRAPHNEIIVDNCTGILVKASDIDLYDNDEALVKGGVFDNEHFAEIIKRLSPALSIQLAHSCIDKHNKEYSLQALSKRLLGALGHLI